MTPPGASRPPRPPAAGAGRAGAALWTAPYGVLDTLRRAQGDGLASLGFGPAECRHAVIASDRLWRLREYEGTGDGPPVLIVAAPIKRPYIWDLTRRVSAVRLCLDRGLRVFLLEWLPAPGGAGEAGLAAYAERSVGEAVDRVTGRAGGEKPFLMGHSLGGTFAAVHAMLAGERLRGLVLLSAPLCFTPGSCRFRDALMKVMPSSIGAIDVMPGSLLTQLCVCASPDIFVWSRAIDAGLSTGDREALQVAARVERWALDELPLSGALVGEIFEDLYRENRLCAGTLEIAGQRLDPAALGLPVLAAASTADEIAPPASVRPFLEAATSADRTFLEHGDEVGVGLQHLGVLVGRHAHARLWPRIIRWLESRR